MRRSNISYYILFILLITGTFASMAQNDYGNTLIGFVAFAFSLLFLYQLSERTLDRWEQIELTSLSLIAGILALRVFLIRFPYVEWLFGAAGTALIMVYGWRMLTSWRTLSPENKMAALLLVLFFGGIAAYSFSMTITPFIPALSQPTGVAGFVAVTLFVSLAISKRYFMISGEKTTAFNMVMTSAGRPIIIITFFLLSTAYLGLTQLNLIPQLYSDDYPQVYYQMVRSAEEGKEKKVNSTYRHEAFKKAYDAFVQRNKTEGE